MDSVIFDVDGTLWDSRIPVARAWNDSFRRHTGVDRHLTAEQITPLFGRTMEQIISVLLPQTPQRERERLGELCFADEVAWLAREPGTIYPGVEKTLAALREDYPLYIVSNCQKGYIEVMLEKTGLGPFFSDWLSFGDTRRGKAENLVTLCRQNGLTEPCYVGDTQGDADACAAAGIPFVHAAYGFGTAENPRWRIFCFSELLDILG